jgi:hypothetical protein
MNYFMNKLFKISSLGLGCSLIITCAQTPNNVSLSVAQGLCVTAGFPGYESVATTYSQAFPLNANMPANAPYCVAITITNNNSGTNANNIQVYSSGLTVTYPSINGNISYSMIDYNAAMVPASSFNNTQQQVYNLNLFDPHNCVTTQGANVQTLGANGGSCQFFLALNSESLPIGVYPINITVNYTNGNTAYGVSTQLNQRVNLYVGGNFNTPVANLGITNASTTQPAADTLISANSPESFVVTALARDLFGNVYTGDILGNVYKYNGTSNSSWAQIPSGAGGLPGGGAISGLTTDAGGNLYVATALGQIYQVNNGLIPATVNYMGTIPTINPVAVQVLSNQLLIAAGNLVYSCALSVISPTSCSTVPITSGPQQVINQMISTGNTVSIAANLGVWSYNGGDWISVPAGTSGLPAESITAIAYFTNLITRSSYWYAAINQLESSISSVYIESGGAPFTPLLSQGSNAWVSGIVRQVVVDAAGAVYLGGASLLSTDYAGQYAAIAYLPSFSGAVNVFWTPISGINGTVNALQTASQLTPY